MLSHSRALVKARRGPQTTGESSLPSSSIFEYEDFLFGYIKDIPLISFNYAAGMNNENEEEMTLRQVLRASVGVMGESPLGMTEKVVVLGGKISAVKRFKRVVIRKNEFGRRIERLANIGNQSHYLVPLTAYLYAKRIKFVVTHYYPMGTLAHLLSGAKEEGHTALEWKHRYRIILCIARAIEFIHSQNPPRDKNLKLNVHGNIKTSNVMINIDFTARLSDYGFVQLAEQAAVEDTGQAEVPAPPLGLVYKEKLSQESDIYNFGVVLMDILGWPGVERSDHVFEFCVGGEENKQASNVLEIALRCTNSLLDARPTIKQILSWLEDSVK
ncbi:hypothetical protein C2S51_012502 [Perilla frutescens var. frutescens]|nr:hypothetical protein C2S51_012502 [Perilla frutescens var. frutescens]